MIEEILHIDQALFLWLNAHHHTAIDVAMQWITERNTWIPFYLMLIVYLVYQLGWNKGLSLVLLLFLAVGLSDFLASGVFKPYFQRLRPCNDVLIKDSVHLVKGCGGKYGFVSSHAANVFALFMGLNIALKWNRFFKYSVLSWAIIVAYSRIYVGVHYPLDIIFGAILGIITTFLVFRLFNTFIVKAKYG